MTLYVSDLAMAINAQLGLMYFNAGCSALASRYVEVKRKAPLSIFKIQQKTRDFRVFCCMKMSIFATNIKSKSFSASGRTCILATT
jgi:RNase adaptor protein for sRNA GlmZ degradation